VKEREPLILSGFPQELGYTNIGLQSNSGNELIERFLLMNSMIMDNAPMHIAVHLIKNIDTPPEPYAQIHSHPDCDEIGLIIAPKDELEYEIVLNGKENRVKSPAAVYIPAGTYHRARALSGSGAYVCIILDPRGPLADNITVTG
jgi:mannose-6-phosphate isomerase-like protein (cupin superfamily)